MGLTSFLTGYIIGEGPHGEMTNFYINGIISIICAYACIYLARFLKAPAKPNRIAFTNPSSPICEAPPAPGRGASLPLWKERARRSPHVVPPLGGSASIL